MCTLQRCRACSKPLCSQALPLPATLDLQVTDLAHDWPEAAQASPRLESCPAGPEMQLGTKLQLRGHLLCRGSGQLWSNAVLYTGHAV